jgi:DNA mismatch endonuclease (patch repair protein)
MLANRDDSKPEQALRSLLHRRGLRFRKHAQAIKGLRCRPDVLFPRRRIAVFVDGCFWHRCPIHGTQPKASGAWWTEKLDANVARDRRNDQSLQQAGWTVLRFWEHEPLESMADRVQQAVRSQD